MKGVQDAKRWLTIREAAYLIQRNPSNLYRWIERGYLHARRSDDGRTMEVDRDDLVPAQARAAEYDTAKRRSIPS